MKFFNHPAWYFSGAFVLALVGVAQLTSGTHSAFEAFLWLAGSGFLLYWGYKKYLVYKVDKQLEAEQQAKLDQIYAKIKAFYLSELKGDQVLEGLDKLLLDLSTSENIDETLVKGSAEKAARNVIDELVKAEIADGTLSPDGQKKIFDSASKIDVDLQVDADTEKLMARLRLNWDLDHGELPVVGTELSLPKGEVCHFTRSCQWHENRTITRSVSYGGLAGSFRIAKGIRYRVGNVHLQRITSESLTLIDQGKLYVTNKRVIFMGQKRNTNIKYAAILSIEPYSDAVCIEKDSGKSPYLMCSDADILARLLVRLNHD